MTEAKSVFGPQAVYQRNGTDLFWEGGDIPSGDVAWNAAVPVGDSFYELMIVRIDGRDGWGFHLRGAEGYFAFPPDVNLRRWQVRDVDSDGDPDVVFLAGDKRTLWVENREKDPDLMAEDLSSCLPGEQIVDGAFTLPPQNAVQDAISDCSHIPAFDYAVGMNGGVDFRERLRAAERLEGFGYYRHAAEIARGIAQDNIPLSNEIMGVLSRLNLDAAVEMLRRATTQSDYLAVRAAELLMEHGFDLEGGCAVLYRFGSPATRAVRERLFGVAFRPSNTEVAASMLLALARFDDIPAYLAAEELLDNDSHREQALREMRRLSLLGCDVALRAAKALVRSGGLDRSQGLDTFRRLCSNCDNTVAYEAAVELWNCDNQHSLDTLLRLSRNWDDSAFKAAMWLVEHGDHEGRQKALQELEKQSDVWSGVYGKREAFKTFLLEQAESLDRSCFMLLEKLATTYEDRGMDAFIGEVVTGLVDIYLSKGRTDKLQALVEGHGPVAWRSVRRVVERGGTSLARDVLNRMLATVPDAEKYSADARWARTKLRRLP